MLLKSWSLSLLIIRGHILFDLLKIPKQGNAAPVLLAIPVSWNRVEIEKVAQLVFEKLNFPGVFFIGMYSSVIIRTATGYVFRFKQGECRYH